MTSTTGGEGTESTASGLVPNQLAALVPTFDPAKDDIQEYAKKVQLLLGMWPEGRWTELATRLILGTSGTAFQKLQLNSEEVTKNEKKSISTIIQLLGGQWGQIPLEKRYEAAERALFRCQQRSDETNDSYLARADVLWQELINKSFKIEDLQAYITLRGSNLSSDDKKRVLLESEAGTEGKLTLKAVQTSVRMLGAGFFHEMVSGKKTSKLKTYDQQALIAEGEEEAEDDSHPTFTVDQTEEDWEILEALVTEGDDDAALVTDFEAAATDVLQSDSELAGAFTAYTEARRRLSEKVRSRGFWPLSSGKSNKGKGKSFGKGARGKSGKGYSAHRKSLQQRILESKCRICDQVGHWKAECPQRANAANKPPQAITTFAQVDQDLDAMPLEFLQLPSHEAAIDVSSQQHSNVACVLMTDTLMHRHLQHENNPKHRLKQSLGKWKTHGFIARVRNDRADGQPPGTVPSTLQTTASAPDELVCFASHGCCGIVDLGATKTVIGSNLVGDLLNELNPEVRKQVTKCACQINFRFGNQGMLQSKYAIVIPIFGFKLKVAIVPGSTPFLLSNTLLRAIGAVIDTDNHTIFARKIKHQMPIRLTSKGLFLLDLNDLARSTKPLQTCAETHVITDGSENRPILIDAKITDENPAVCHSATQIHQPITDSTVCTSEVPNNDSITNELKQHKQHVVTDERVNLSMSPAAEIAEVLPTKSIASSHRVIDKCSKHVAHSTPSAPACGSHHPEARFQSPLTGRTEADQSGFREHTSRQELRRSVGHQPTVCPVVPPEVREQYSCQSCPLRALHRPDDRTCRRSRSASPSPSGKHSQRCQASHDQGEEQSKGINSATNSTIGDRLLERVGGRGIDQRSPSPRSRSGIDQSTWRTPGGENGSHGGCLAASHPAHQEPVRATDCPSLTHVSNAGDASADCLHTVDDGKIHESKEKQHFWNMVKQFERELQQTPMNHHRQDRLDLIEVYCSENSQRTHQCRQLGFKAERFGLAQGDLTTVTGRQTLFSMFKSRRPRNAWLSPICGPWSSWSNLNGSKSVDAWDELESCGFVLSPSSIPTRTI